MKAFTLVEMMVSVAIFAALFLALFGILSTGNNIFQRDAFLLELQQNARNATDRIVRELRESKSSTITVINTNSDRISFNTPNETGILYYLSSGRLIREYPSGSVMTVASNITRLKFTKNTKFMTIDLKAQKTYMGTTYTFPLLKYVRLRNE